MTANNQIADETMKEVISNWIEEGHNPQNVMLVTEDNGFNGILQQFGNAGHITMLTFHEIKKSGKLLLLKFARSLPSNGIGDITIFWNNDLCLWWGNLNFYT